jgi:hypothetical protein
MKGRSTFTRPEIEELRRLIREKQTADRDRQKAIRARMRRMGFHISDFGQYHGFVVSDLDELIAGGLITLVDDEPQAMRTATRSSSDHAAQETDTLGETKELEAYVRDALLALERGHSRPIAQAEAHVPPRPGLYAIHGSAETWVQLGLGEPPDKRPLYAGKAEDSLIARDFTTHFGDGRTGQSTMRRSFAALLHDALGLRGMPRNPDKPAYYSNYGLSAAHDATLTRWMRERLQLATWPKPREWHFTLKEVETALLRKLCPPLNLTDVVTPWTARVKTARAVMAAEARAWAADGR